MSQNVTNSIPSTLNDLLVKLKILSMIERGKKINMASMTFTDSTSWFGALSRTISGEGRKSFILYLSQTIQQAINAISEYRDTEFARIIVNDLSNAKIGIQNLTTTYHSDPLCIAQLEIYIANIDLQLEKNRDLLEGHQVINRRPLHNEDQNGYRNSHSDVVAEEIINSNPDFLNGSY